MLWGQQQQQTTNNIKKANKKHTNVKCLQHQTTISHIIFYI